MISAIAVFDIDGIVRDVSGSYRRALADTVEQFTQGAFRPSQTEIDTLKTEGLWNNDWEASQELIYRYFEAQGKARSQLDLNYDAIIAFFQSRYRGADPQNPDRWTGYITQEPMLMQATYLTQLTEANIAWGFFSGATRGSATYALEKRLGLQSPVLVAMEDAPGKPDPTGLLQVVQRLEAQHLPEDSPAVLYIGDTVADMQTAATARSQQPDRLWIAVGVLPPHAQQSADYQAIYQSQLEQAGAAIVLDHVEQLDPEQIRSLLR